MSQTKFQNPRHATETSSILELLKILETSSKLIESTLHLSSSISYPEEPQWAGVRNKLKQLNEDINISSISIKNYLEALPQTQKKSVSKIDHNPMLIPTPESCEYNSQAGRAKMQVMNQDELYSYIMRQNNQPMTREMRKEAELYLKRNFPSSVVHPSVIKRVMIANRFQLASCHLHLEAWIKADCPREFKWKPLGAEQSRVQRMIFDYEVEETKRHAGGSNGQTSKKQVDLYRPLSLPLILELQFLKIHKELNLSQSLIEMSS
jgi:hypothetical protein